MKRADIPAAAAIVEAAYPGTGSAAEVAADIEDMWSNAAAKPVYYVYETEGIILGFVGYKICEMTWNAFQAFWMTVDPKHQREGVGTKLFSFILDEMRSQGVQYVLVHTFVPDFCKKFGFKEIDRLRDVPLMSLHL